MVEIINIRVHTIASGMQEYYAHMTNKINSRSFLNFGSSSYRLIDSIASDIKNMEYSIDIGNNHITCV